MGGDDSQKLLPWRGIHSSPGRKPPAQLRNQQYLILRLEISRGGHHRSGRASATDRLDHFWKAEAGQFWRAPKDAGDALYAMTVGKGVLYATFDRGRMHAP